MKKWTIKELNAIDNITFAKTLLSERKDALTYYSPLAKKLSEAIAELNGISESRRQLQEKESNNEVSSEEDKWFIDCAEER